MKKGEIVTGIVTGVQFPNKALVHVTEPEEADILVKNLLPGQRVSVRIKKKRKGRYEGNLIRVESKAPNEMDAPACPHADGCGGCLYQTLPCEEQLALKRTQVLDVLRPVLPEADRLFEGIKASPLTCGYRNKMEYTFGDEYQGGPLSLGLHKRGAFYDILSVGECRIADPDFGRILKATRDFFEKNGTPYYHRMRHEGVLRHLLVRKAAYTGEILVDLITTGGFEVPRDWCRLLLELPLEGSLAGILHTVNDSLADAVKDEGTTVLWGKGSFRERCLGLDFTITPFSFFQTNTRGAEILYETAREYISDSLVSADTGALEDSFRYPDRPGAGAGKSSTGAYGKKVVYDLYSGTGTIAQILAPAAKQVIGVEIVEEAVEAAKKNARENGLTNCDFLAGDVLGILDQIEQKPDVIVLDPPRDGVHPKALKKILDYGVGTILYISCKPVSLARDLVMLQEGGYEVKRFCCVDMFPGTVHVETVCLLSQRKPDTTIEVDLDISELEVSSAETKATYEEIKSYVLKKFGLKVSNLYIAQVKRECGIVERINYNLPKTEGNRVPQCPEDKRKAIKDAFIHFQMI